MATIRKRKDRNGEDYYQIRVFLGKNINGNQVCKYHTYKPEQGMTDKQIEKALERESVLFEEKCRSGELLDTRITFAGLSELWCERKKNIHSMKHQHTVKERLKRINSGIGHIKVGNLKPHHIQALIDNLSEPGVKKTNVTATSNNLAETLIKRDISKAALARLSNVSEATIHAICRGKAVKINSAEKIAAALNIPIKKLFTVNNRNESLSARTIHHHHKIISAILESAVKWQIIKDNPARRVETPKVSKKEAAYLDDKQALIVLDALLLAPIKWRTIIMLLMHSGMRRGELCGLSWNDIDFDENIIHIRKSNQYLPEVGIFEKETKTEDSERVIKLPATMFALLEEYRTWQTSERLKMQNLWHISNKVFCQENGKPIHPDSITSWVAKFREKNSLPYFTPHTLRHTNATLLIMQGLPIKVVASRLGHSSEITTGKIYSHVIKTMDAIASDVIGDILKPSAKKKSG